MPVYLLTAHAYRSWPEDHPDGYVQRREGLKPPSEALAKYRAGHALHPEARFGPDLQELIQEVAVAIAEERAVRLHGCATTPTHVHILISFRSPACTCGAWVHCMPGCEARDHAEAVIVRMKRKMGQAVAKKRGTQGRPWFSRGWDIEGVRTRNHFDHLMETYLPGHESEQAGIFRREKE